MGRPAAKPLVTNTSGGAPVPATPSAAATAAGSQTATMPGSAAASSGYRADSTATGGASSSTLTGGHESSGVSGAGSSGPDMAASQAGGPRTARLTIASVDPWSVLKLSFLLSVALGIALVVASIVLWSVLNGMGVFESVNSVLGDISGSNDAFDIYQYVGFGRVVSLSVVIGAVNVILITALATISAFLYNLGAGLVGGLHVTLSDD
jgi:hypothetical protein